MPVIVLSDQALSSRIEAIPGLPAPDQIARHERLLADPARTNGDEYARYAMTEDGVSPMSLPGMPGLHYTAESLEHLENGAPDYTPEQHVAMMDKRWRKLEAAYQTYRTWPTTLCTFGTDDPDVGIITWGTSAGAVREAVGSAQARGQRVAACVPKVLSPLPREELQAFASRCKAILIPELNSRGQFAMLLRAETGIDGYRLNKYDGLPFTACEIEDKINAITEELGLGERLVEGQV
jgi:2-oxoglutarate ferredoxin oxidoreductase subunit alpha